MQNDPLGEFLTAAFLRAAETKQPVMVFFAGSNGAGKTTAKQALAQTAKTIATSVDWINADEIASDLRQAGIPEDQIDVAAQQEAEQQRAQALVNRRNFMTETVFSDEGGHKLNYLRAAIEQGFLVVLVFIGICSVQRSIERVALRVSQNGHDVPLDKLHKRWARTRHNFHQAITFVPWWIAFDNSDDAKAYIWIAEAREGVRRENAWPDWLDPAFIAVA